MYKTMHVKATKSLISLFPICINLIDGKERKLRQIPAQFKKGVCLKSGVINSF